MGKSYPKWVDLDESDGWPWRPGGVTITGSVPHVRFLHAGAHPDSPDVHGENPPDPNIKQTPKRPSQDDDNSEDNEM
jgi:hypothetical protein